MLINIGLLFVQVHLLQHVGSKRAPRKHFYTTRTGY